LSSPQYPSFIDKIISDSLYEFQFKSARPGVEKKLVFPKGKLFGEAQG
jgi:hypothetical protein